MRKKYIYKTWVFTFRWEKETINWWINNSLADKYWTFASKTVWKRNKTRGERKHIIEEKLDTKITRIADIRIRAAQIN